jgi:DnaK suppressor protein
MTRAISGVFVTRRIWQIHCMSGSTKNGECAAKTEGVTGIMSAQATKVARDQKARDRYVELKRILEERRREIMNEVQDRMRDVRSEGAGQTIGVLDAAESSEADIQDDIEFALIQMKAETLNRIDEALARLEEGTFGYCFECGEEISERRLRALPFAVRCKDCEEAREAAQQRERVLAQRRGAASLFFDTSS